MLPQGQVVSVHMLRSHQAEEHAHLARPIDAAVVGQRKVGYRESCFFLHADSDFWEQTSLVYIFS